MGTQANIPDITNGCFQHIYGAEAASVWFHPDGKPSIHSVCMTKATPNGSVSQTDVEVLEMTAYAFGSFPKRAPHLNDDEMHFLVKTICQIPGCSFH